MAGSLCPSELMRKGANRNAFSRNGNWLRHDETSQHSNQTMRHLTKELAQWVEFTAYRNKIIHPGTDQIVPIGETGELCSGYCVMLATGMTQSKQKEAIDTAGWMHSGDLATMDEEGYINMWKNQRHDHRGGENIYPKVIEEFYTPIKLKKSPFLNSR
jgi:fatty-acyl-CoA synthase